MKPFASIYAQYFDFVWASTRRLGVAPGAVDDVVQDVFIVIHSRLHTLQEPAALRSWIYSIVRRVVGDHRRALRVRAASAQGLSPEEDVACGPTPLDIATQNERVKLLFALLEELDESKREVFMMAELDQLTIPEVAEILQIPLNTAYSRLRTARQAFERALARHAARNERKAEP